MKATYWLTGKYKVAIERNQTADKVVVFVEHHDRALTEIESTELEARFRRDLIDFRTRAIVESETRVLRELLVAKAFAHGDED